MNPALPRILLVEDDPVSASFLRDAAATLPAQVTVAASIGEALDATGASDFDLCLIDANLPDGRGEYLLGELRRRGIDSPALAHTAAADAVVSQRLCAAGFLAVLCKPLGIAELQAAVRRHLPAPACGKLPLWDDDAAAAALGLPAHVSALRGLFLQELPGQRERIEHAAGIGDEATVRAELHRLAASCGFVGAARLGAAVRELQGAPLDQDRLQRFGFVVDDALGSG